MVTFRPTRPQALGLGAHLGGLVGAAAGVALLVVTATGLVRPGLPGWLAAMLTLVAGLVVGAGLGLAFGRDTGADIDDLGIHPVPRLAGEYAPWGRIEDLRAERRGGRTYVAVCFDTGQTTRLRAPYDGQFLARDPEFERKLFMLRNLWETHRSFTINKHQTPTDGS